LKGSYTGLLYNKGRQSWGGRGGVAEGSWTGFGKHYSVFCAESMLENVFL